ncbi:type III-B CRISPR module-associated Cmr3 family protein [Psychrobacter immobilis]|uniref:type III-B CRISPR module-associated Cmr3 family protein n=1 Tax=Psychrobacter immobilis TaxID=498 RepID=UPI001918AF02|nr:type III-B CRISPR module-associated Cmr3 family protein [Psychrobacter immobilis]
MKSMNYYIIDALAPLVFRSGKPFGAQAAASDANIPLPSSSAGLMRSQYMRTHQIALSENGEQNRGTLKKKDYEKLLDIATFGNLLVRFPIDHPQDFTIMVPKPSNAMYLKEKSSAQSDESQVAETVLVRLAPAIKSNDDDSEYGTDLPNGLQLVQMTQSLKGKPQKGANFWCLDDFMAWQSGKDLTFDAVSKNGLESIPIDVRTHVAINDTSLSSEDGQLFQTAGLDTAAKAQPHHAGWDENQLGFLTGITESIDTTNPSAKQPDTLVRFGGEGRLSKMITVTNEATTTLAPPVKLNQHIKDAGGICVTLLTPAIFSAGYLPAWLDNTTLEGVFPHSATRVRLKAAAVDRWQPVSGWDLQQYKPKAMRKATPAGSVYWFELLDDCCDIESAWLMALSDDLQDQRDGFGIATIHPWQQV